MKHSLQFPSDTAGLTVRIGADRQDLSAAFELVYQSYIHRGYIARHCGTIVYRPTFGLPTSRTLVATGPGREVVGTLTIVGDNPWGFQLETTFAQEVQALRAHGRSVAEVTCLAIASSARFPLTAIFFALTHFLIHYAHWRQIDDLLLAIHPKHRRFYWRRFRAVALSACRRHGEVNGNPAICCRIDLHRLRQVTDPQVWQQYYGFEPPTAAFLESPISPEDHHHFCCRAGLELGADSTDGRAWKEHAA